MMPAQQILETLSPLGLGTSRLASLGSAPSKSDAHRLIHTALDLGIRVIDTADTYGSGDAERVLGDAIRGRRENVFLVTKAGFPYVALPVFFSPLNQIGKKVRGKLSPRKNYSKRYLLESLGRSLRRLRTETVDAFLLHEPSARELTDESWEALEQIRSRGMARNVGVSTSELDVVKRGLASGILQMLETSIIPTSESILQLSASKGIPVVANMVLQPLQDPSTAEKLRRLAALCPGASPVSLLLARAAMQPAVKTVLVGTRSVDHLRDNARLMLQASSLQAILPKLEKLLPCL